MAKKPKRKMSPRSLANLRSWKPGQSGNPGGRSKGIMAFVKERCGESGERLILALEAIALGNAEDHKRVFGVKRALHVTTRDRISALQELLDRGFGRAIQSMEVNTTATPLFALPGPQVRIPDLGNGPGSGMPLVESDEGK